MQVSDLHVVSIVFNPQRYKSRYNLFREYQKQIEASGVQHWIGEAAFGARPYEVTESGNPRHIQVRVQDEIWIKEALINRVVQALPMDWKYVLINDADIQFVRPDWAMETIQQLQHYAVIQPWSDCVNLGPNREVMREGGKALIDQSFCSIHLQGIDQGAINTNYYGSTKEPFRHPGFSWAYRREAWEALGGLIDFAILGAADHHMATALIGRTDRSMPKGLHPNYVKGVETWEGRATRHIRHNIGCVTGTILHGFHGWRVNRKYRERWSILIDNNYDPQRDIKYDYSAIPQLTSDKPRLRDEIRRYFAQRAEDVLV
jgi:hypothetical protein